MANKSSSNVSKELVKIPRLALIIGSDPERHERVRKALQAFECSLREVNNPSEIVILSHDENDIFDGIVLGALAEDEEGNIPPYRNHPNLSRTPIVALTDAFNSTVAWSLYEAGADIVRSIHNSPRELQMLFCSLGRMTRSAEAREAELERAKQQLGSVSLLGRAQELVIASCAAHLAFLPSDLIANSVFPQALLKQQRAEATNGSTNLTQVLTMVVDLLDQMVPDHTSFAIHGDTSTDLKLAPAIAFSLLAHLLCESHEQAGAHGRVDLEIDSEASSNSKICLLISCERSRKIRTARRSSPTSLGFSPEPRFGMHMAKARALIDGSEMALEYKISSAQKMKFRLVLPRLSNKGSEIEKS